MRSEAWRPAAAARNRSPREARDPARQALRPGCEELAVTDPAQMPVRQSAAPGAQNRHGGAPRGERPASWDARRLASAWHATLLRAQRVLRRAPERLSALRPPLIGVSEATVANPGRRHAPRERDGLFE